MTDLIKMPQPRDVPDPSDQFSERHGPEALDQIPKARDCIADTIAYYSAAEANMRIFLLSSFGPDTKGTEKLIQMARSDDFLDVLLPVAAANRGRPDMNTAIQAFRDARYKVKSIRDTFAHGVFAQRSDLPGCVLLMRADPYRKAHQEIFAQIASDPLAFPNATFKFKAWSQEDFMRARDLARALLNAAQAMSLCFARAPEEVGQWRESLERQGLLDKPPHLG